MWSISWAALKKGSDVVAASSYAAQEKSQKRWCQSQRHTVQHSLDRHVKRWKKASCFTLLRRITNSKLWIRKSFQRVKFLPGKVFTEGFMPPWRIQHESHTCLETFYRIIDVKCIGRAKNTPITPDRGNWKIRNKYIYILYHGDHQLRLRCAQVRHHSPAGTFSRVPGRCLRWSPTRPGPRWTPCKI